MTKPYKVLIKSNNKANDDVVSIDKFLDSDLFFNPSSAQIMLANRGGKYTIESATKIRHLEEIKIEWDRSDITGNGKYSKKFLVTAILPQTSASGKLLVLELMSYEGMLDKVTMSGSWSLIRVDHVLNNIVKIYNENRAESQPMLVLHSEFARAAWGSFNFGDDTSVLNALRHVVSYLELSPAQGGLGQRFSVTCEDDLDGQNTIRITIKPQGETPKLELESKDRKKITRTYEVQHADLTLVRGNESSGSMPIEISQYEGLQEEYDNLPIWVNSVGYDVGHYVQWDGKVWKAKIGTNDEPGNADWDAKTFEQYVIDQIGNVSYSPWTRNKALEYKKYTLNTRGYESAGFLSPAFPDSNLIIEERSSNNPTEDFIQQEVMEIVRSLSLIHI